MGCDGGTIPKRDELVRTKKKGEQKDKTSELAFKWKHCAISQEVLVKPIVACELGRLYNKESVLEFLLDRTKFDVASQFDHLRGLKDIKELNLTDNPESKSRDPEKCDGYSDPSISDFICPVVGLEMSGTFKFCFLWSCGCVISERALREVKTETCHKCGKVYQGEDDVVILNGSDEEVVEMRAKMERRRAAAKVSKKTKKAVKHKLPEPASEGEIASKKTCEDTPSSSSSSSPQSQKSKLVNGLNKDGASSKTGVGRLITANGKPATDKGSKLKTSTIQSDPKTSKTFKSLFTTCEDAKNRKVAHWVTYNPLYY
ncbi:replication termination factor 2-like [Physella acuta]|uniref:replication termination factor 2-like n=1 Tax=Physella acuta TaxID=109671 RepID=UPI0027DC63DE|nr:replication termination factor 2-like [Physella acuta]